jgi:hypothetical protein
MGWLIRQGRLQVHRVTHDDRARMRRFDAPCILPSPPVLRFTSFYGVLPVRNRG